MFEASQDVGDQNLGLNPAARGWLRKFLDWLNLVVHCKDVYCDVQCREGLVLYWNSYCCGDSCVS